MLVVENMKGLAMERAGLDRTVQQLIEIVGTPSIPFPGEGTVHLPGVSTADTESMGTPAAAIQLHHHRSKAEGRELRVDKGRSNGQVPRFHHIGEAVRNGIDVIRQPLVGGQTPQRNGACCSCQLKTV